MFTGLRIPTCVKRWIEGETVVGDFDVCNFDGHKGLVVGIKGANGE